MNLSEAEVAALRRAEEALKGGQMEEALDALVGVGLASVVVGEDGQKRYHTDHDLQALLQKLDQYEK